MRMITKAWFLAMLFLISLAPALGMTFGEARDNTTFLVSGLPQDAVVQFILNGGVPVFATVNASGTAQYLPLLEGNLDIVVMLNNIVIESKSITVLPAPTATQPSGSTGNGGGGGGSGGGGGVITGEPLANIAKSETKEGSLTAGKPVAFTFISPEIAIHQILITGNESENNVTVRVESLKNTSKLVSRAAPGTVYVNTNVWVKSKKITGVTLKFRVTNAWITGGNVQKENIKLLRWSDNDWKALNTTVLTRDDTYSYFEAQSAGLSSFAISAMKEGQVPVVTTLPSTTAATPATNASTPGKKPTPGFGMLVAVMAISAIYLLRRRDG